MGLCLLTSRWKQVAHQPVPFFSFIYVEWQELLLLPRYNKEESLSIVNVVYLSYILLQRTFITSSFSLFLLHPAWQVRKHEGKNGCLKSMPPNFIQSRLLLHCCFGFRLYRVEQVRAHCSPLCSLQWSETLLHNDPGPSNSEELLDRTF